MNKPKCVGAQSARKMIAENVSEGRWSIVAVASDGVSPSFIYSVGLHSLGYPELIIIGLNPKIGHDIINNCAELMKSNGSQFESGSFVENLANLPLAILDANDLGKMEYAVQGFNFYRHWNFKLQQLVMPDVNKRYPWQEGFDQNMSKIQDLIGTWPANHLNSH